MSTQDTSPSSPAKPGPEPLIVTDEDVRGVLYSGAPQSKVENEREYINAVIRVALKRIAKEAGA